MGSVIRNFGHFFGCGRNVLIRGLGKFVLDRNWPKYVELQRTVSRNRRELNYIEKFRTM